MTEPFSDPAFARTVDAFRRALARHPETGGQLSIRGRRDLHVSAVGGMAGDTPWTRHETANVWSVSKAVAAVTLSSALRPVGQSLESPAGAPWPTSRAGRTLSIGEVLGHRLGLVGLRRPVEATDLLDTEAVTEQLVRTEPWWDPGTEFGYHSWTYGAIILQLARSAGVDLEQALGLLCAREHGAYASFRTTPARVAPLVALDVPQSRASRALATRDALETVAALRNPTLTAADANSRWWRDLVLPSAKCVANADAISLVLSQLLGGGSVSARDAALHLSGMGRGTDRVLGDDREFSAGLVVGHSDSSCPYSTTGRIRYGHDGLGGSFVCVDPDAELVLCFVTNGMGRDINTDPRKIEILEAFDDDTR